MLGPFDGWRISSNYGWRIHPIEDKRKHHNGVDLVKAHKHPITPFMTGRVIKVGGMGTAGIVVFIEDHNHYEHRYFHLNHTECFHGQIVGWNDVIGYQGKSGNVTGSHLHYEVRDENGIVVNPEQYLRSEYMDFQKQLDTLNDRLNTIIENQQELNEVMREKEPPEWFIKQFEDMRIESVILEMKGSRDFWRGVAISHRLIEYHRANYKFDTE